MVSKNIVLERIKLDLVTVIVFKSLFLFNTDVVLNNHIFATIVNDSQPKWVL